MLVEIEVQNFKSLADKVTFSSLQDVNVLLGENNSGKSSLLQILNFIKLSLLKKDLIWNDKKTGFHLGSFEEIIYNGETSRELIIKLSFKLNINDEFKKQIKKTKYKDFDFSIIRWSFSIIKLPDGIYIDKEIIEDNKYDEIFCINHLKGSTPSLTFSMLQDNYAISKSTGGTYPLNWLVNLSSFKNQGMEELQFLVEYIRTFIDYKIRNMFFLSVDRITKDWSASVDREPKILGDHGDNTVSLFHYIFSGDPTVYNEINSVIKDTFGSEKITSPLHSPLHNGQAEIRFEIEGLDHQPNIINCGGGINQLIPLNILCNHSPNNSILLIEEPELCLHPRAENKQLNTFFNLVKDEKQVFITTHSLTNLYNLIKQGRDKKKAKIFYLKLTKTKTIIEKEYTLPKDTEKYGDAVAKLIFELGLTDSE